MQDKALRSRASPHEKKAMSSKKLESTKLRICNGRQRLARTGPPVTGNNCRVSTIALPLRQVSLT